MNPRTFAYYNFGMGIFMLFMASALFFFPPPVMLDSPSLRYFIPPVLIAYGLFRIYRAMKVLRNTSE